MTSCSRADSYRRFEGTQCLGFENERHSENGGNDFPQNANSYLTGNITLAQNIVAAELCGSNYIILFLIT